jgi:acyl carrier protein
MKRQVIDFICDFFESRGKFQGEAREIYIHENFVELKTLDSIEFITLIADTEAEFDFAFKQEHIESPQFSSVEGIASMVDSILQS